MPTKVNIVLDDDVKAELDQLVESGLRSRVINQALRREILFLRRQQAIVQMDDLRKRSRPIAADAIVAQVRRDRGR